MRARGDEERVRQILLNLVSNAVKFTPRGGQVKIVCSTTDQTVRVEVQDAGIGIPRDKLGAVFEPFVQLQRNAGSRAGTGLGLAISRDLAQAMHGTLSVSSEPGEESVFCLELRD